MKRALVLFLFAFFLIPRVSSAAVTFGASSFTATVGLMNGLVGHWTFDGFKIAGTNALDSSTQNNTGVLTNSPTKTQGKIGQALSFNGSNYVATTYSGVTGNAARTVSLWFKTTRSTNPIEYQDTLIAYGAGVVAQIFQLATNNDYGTPTNHPGISVDVGGGAVTYNTPGYANGQWHHVVAVAQAGASAETIKVYYDGVLLTSVEGSVTPSQLMNTASSNNLQIGAFNGGRRFTGSIDDVRLYNRPLSETEVRLLYQRGTAKVLTNATPTGSGTGLVGYYPMDLSDINAGGQVFDRNNQGGVKNNGVVVGRVTRGAGQVGQAIGLNGTTGYVDLPAGTFGSLTNNMTIMAWVKPRSLVGTPRIASAARTLGSNGFGFGFFGAKQIFTTFGVKDYIGTADVGKVGVWQHMTAVMDSSNAVTFYYNGQKGDTITHDSPGVANNDDHFFIGMSTDSDSSNLADGCDCDIDEFRVYNRVLSAKEVQDVYSQARAQTLNTNDTTKNTSGLVLNQTFNGVDVAGTAALDRSGNANHGVLTNGPKATQGKVGQGLKFDGVNDFVTTNDTSLPAGSSDRTISAWINTRVNVNFGVIFKYGTNSLTNMFWMGTNASGGITVTQNGASTPTSGVTVTDGKWHLITVTLTGGTNYVMYVDGVVRGTASMSTNTILNGNSSIGFSDDAGSRIFTGSIDEVRVYNRALSAGEVAALYKLGQ